MSGARELDSPCVGQGPARPPVLRIDYLAAVAYYACGCYPLSRCLLSLVCPERVGNVSAMNRWPRNRYRFNSLGKNPKILGNEVRYVEANPGTG